MCCTFTAETVQSLHLLCHFQEVDGNQCRVPKFLTIAREPLSRKLLVVGMQLALFLL